MRTLSSLLLVLVCLGFGLSSPHAAMRDAAVEIGIFGGSYQLTEEDTDADSTTSVFGFRAGFLITEEHEIEFTYDTAEYVFAGIDLEEINSWNLRYLYNWSLGPRQKVVPYIGAGVGQVDDEVFDTFFGDVSDDDTQVTLLGGLRMFADRNFALRGELGYKLFSTFDVDQTVLEMTVGLSWVIGGR